MESKLEAELKQWKEREQRYEKLFSPSVLKSREFLKEKLKHYDEVRAKVIANPIGEDKVALRAFQLERVQLERQVYPNFIRRFLNTVITALRMNNNIEKVRQTTAENHSSVRTVLDRAGLGGHYDQVQQQMKQGNREFSLPVSYQVSEHEKMELQLNFKKDGQGKYLFEGYRASLLSELEKGKQRQHMISASDGNMIDSKMAYNLLAGRAVQDMESGVWKQLDFNDKDADGNIRAKNIPVAYGFDLEKCLAALSLKDMDKEVLLQQLKTGDKVPVSIEVNQKPVMVDVIANPLKKEVALYNHLGEKVTLDDWKEKNGQKGKANVRQLVPQVVGEKKVKSKSMKL